MLSQPRKNLLAPGKRYLRACVLLKVAGSKGPVHALQEKLRRPELVCSITFNLRGTSLLTLRARLYSSQCYLGAGHRQRNMAIEQDVLRC